MFDALFSTLTQSHNVSCPFFTEQLLREMAATLRRSHERASDHAFEQLRIERLAQLRLKSHSHNALAGKSCELDLDVLTPQHGMGCTQFFFFFLSTSRSKIGGGWKKIISN